MLAKVPLSGGTTQTLAVGYGGSWQGIALDGTSVYWSSNAAIYKYTPR